MHEMDAAYAFTVVAAAAGSEQAEVGQVVEGSGLIEFGANLGTGG